MFCTVLLPVIFLLSTSGSCSVMSRRRLRACSRVNPTSRQAHWLHDRRRWLKCAAWLNTLLAMQTNVRAQSLALASFWLSHSCRKQQTPNTSAVVVTALLFLPAGGPHLKCSELLKHVMEVLQSPYCCSAYGEYYSSLLLKDVLSVRKYWCEIAPQQWQSQWV